MISLHCPDPAPPPVELQYPYQVPAGSGTPHWYTIGTPLAHSRIRLVHQRGIPKHKTALLQHCAQFSSPCVVLVAYYGVLAVYQCSILKPLVGHRGTGTATPGHATACHPAAEEKQLFSFSTPERKGFAASLVPVFPEHGAGMILYKL